MPVGIYYEQPVYRGKGDSMRILKWFFVLFLIFSSCAKQRDPEMELADEEETEFAVVKVLYATDRNLSGESEPSEFYGVERADVTYGTCEVSIPRDHRMGELEKPSIWRFEFRENPEKHIVLLKVSLRDKQSFFEELSARVVESDRKNAFIFFHGYKVTFKDAARRTAQMSYDLGFEGAPVFYSWPSRGKLATYMVDEANNLWSQAHITQFLYDFVDRANAENIYLIAHSMGSRALVNSLKELFTEYPDMKEMFTEIILAAPDIDADVFKEQIAPGITSETTRVTVYASSGDIAMDASGAVHGTPRAGSIGASIVLVEGVETIDATGTDMSFIGHSYYAESRTVLSDIFYLIREGMRADQRFALQPVETPAGRYWRFKRE